jgi:hypothetical protein
MNDRSWPPIMRMKIATRYCQFSKWTLARAVRAGDLNASRRGRGLVFKREDLDRWMLAHSVRKPDKGNERSDPGGTPRDGEG